MKASPPFIPWSLWHPFQGNTMTVYCARDYANRMIGPSFPLPDLLLQLNSSLQVATGAPTPFQTSCREVFHLLISKNGNGSMEYFFFIFLPDVWMGMGSKSASKVFDLGLMWPGCGKGVWEVGTFRLLWF